MSLEIQEKALMLARSAIEADNAQCYDQARKHYEGAIALFDSIIPSKLKADLNQSQKDLYISKRIEYTDRLDRIEDHLMTRERAAKAAADKLDGLVIQIAKPQKALSELVPDLHMRNELTSQGSRGMLVFGVIARQPKKNRKKFYVKGLAVINEKLLADIDIRLLVEDYRSSTRDFIEDLDRKLGSERMVLHFKGLTCLNTNKDLVITLLGVLFKLQTIGHILTTTTSKPNEIPESLLPIFKLRVYAPLPNAEFTKAAVDEQLALLDLELADDELDDIYALLHSYTYGEVKRIFYKAFVQKLNQEDSASLSSEDEALTQIVRPLLRNI